MPAGITVHWHALGVHARAFAASVKKKSVGSVLRWGEEGQASEACIQTHLSVASWGVGVRGGHCLPDKLAVLTCHFFGEKKWNFWSFYKVQLGLISSVSITARIELHKKMSNQTHFAKCRRRKEDCNHALWNVFFAHSLAYNSMSVWQKFTEVVVKNTKLQDGTSQLQNRFQLEIWCLNKSVVHVNLTITLKTFYHSLRDFFQTLVFVSILYCNI